MERRLLLDIVVGQRSSILELFAGEDQTLLIRGDALLVLDLRLDVVDGVAGLDIECDGLTREGFDEYLHGCSQLLILLRPPTATLSSYGERGDRMKAMMKFVGVVVIFAGSYEIYEDSRRNSSLVTGR